MTALGWAAVALALLLWPLPSLAQLRWRALAHPVHTRAAPAHRRGPLRRGTPPDDAAVLRVVRVLQAELAAGARPGDALAVAADVEPALTDVLVAAAAAATAGADIAASLAAAPELAGVAAAWRVADAAGAPLGRVLAGVCADLARRVEQHREVSVALAGPRTSALLLAGLPGLGLLLAAGMGAAPLAFLTGTTAGRLVGGAGVLLDALGLAWTARIARRAQRT